MSMIRSAAARTRIARLKARTIGPRKSVVPPPSERYWRTASSATRDDAIASWLRMASLSAICSYVAAGDPQHRRL